MRSLIIAQPLGLGLILPAPKLGLDRRKGLPGILDRPGREERSAGFFPGFFPSQLRA